MPPERVVLNSKRYVKHQHKEGKNERSGIEGPARQHPARDEGDQGWPYENGVVGYGLGKASEVTSAIAKGVEDAKKNLVKIPVLKGTIPHKQEARYSGSLVMIRPAAPGTGVIAGGAMRAVLESVGIRNVLAKSKGSSNPHNLVKATVAALLELRDARSVAQVRGVSLDTVFNG